MTFYKKAAANPPRKERENIMRLWHYQLLPFLPELQFKGQLRELVAIMHDLRDKGKTNHILINRVMEYPKSELITYFRLYAKEYEKRYSKLILDKYYREFYNFDKNYVLDFKKNSLFDCWHNKEYLRVCMANLYEKHVFGVGKSRITDEEWRILLDGYKQITGGEYYI